MFINLCIGIGQKLPLIWSNATTMASFPLSSFYFTFSLVLLTSAFKHATNNKTTCISILSKILLFVTSSTGVHFKQKYTLLLITLMNCHFHPLTLKNSHLSPSNLKKKNVLLRDLESVWEVMKNFSLFDFVTFFWYYLWISLYYSTSF